MSSKRNTSAAPDILQLNMEIISKELNDLIVTGEQEFGMTQHFSMATVKTTAQSFITTPEMLNSFQVPKYITNAFNVQQQQQLYEANALHNINHHLNYCPTFQQPVPFSNVGNTLNNVAGASNMLRPQNYICAGKYLGHSTLRSTQSPYENTSASPSYEFHYLRSHGENEKKMSASMSSLGSQGAFRKMTKLSPKYFNQKMQNSVADNEEIKFDLSALDNIEKESNTVRHLFDLLRDLHRAVAETPPSFESNSDSQFEETFAPVTKKSTMPSTLNVQNQVKQACRKLTIFTYEMQSILSANKVFDAEMHAECEFYLNQLRQYLNQLEMYKRIVMEHKHGKFLREEVKVHAERLSLCLEHTNQQIREVYIRILAVDWYIGVKYRGDVHVAAMQFNTDNNKEITTKSKIGVINEILQLCNTTAETTNAQIEEAKRETIINSSSQLSNNQEVLKGKMLLNRNKDIFNVFKPDHTKRVATLVNTTTSNISHTRHPVFYIG